MRLLLAQRLPYFSARAGEATVNRRLLEALAERHHACRMVALAMPHEGPGTLNELRRTLANRGVSGLRAPSHGQSLADRYTARGVEIDVVRDGEDLSTHLAEQIREFHPDCVLVSQDRTFLTLATALEETDPARIVYLAQSQATLPFGPECFSPDPAKTALLRRAGHVVPLSTYIGDYVRRWSGIEARALPFPSYGRGPFPHLGRHDNPFITMVNPSLLKGVTIFEDLAKARPDVAFAAVPTWATTHADLERLRSLPNARLLPASDQIDDILAQTRILLVPSLWGEGLGLIVVEAMLRGIPVLASDVGGLPEAKMRIDYLLPVHPIERYRQEADERKLPIPIVPRQNLAPWIEALDRLLADPSHYHRLSEASRAAALTHVAGLDVTPFENLFAGLPVDQGGAATREPIHVARPGARGDESAAAAHLSRDRRALLAALLKDGRP